MQKIMQEFRARERERQKQVEQTLKQLDINKWQLFYGQKKRRK